MIRKMKRLAGILFALALVLILSTAMAEKPPIAPTIVTQPVDLSLTYGYTDGNVLSVSASAADGYTLSFQWISNTNASNEGGTPINGATEASYAVPGGKHAGTTEYYYCVVTATRTDNGQTAETVSNAATVSIEKATPEVTAPTADAVSYGAPFSWIPLTNPEGNIPGTWTWATDNGINPNETAVGTVGTHDFPAKFTPCDTVNYNETTMDVTVTVNKANPQITIVGQSEIYGEPRDVVVRFNGDYDGVVTILVGDKEITSSGTTAKNGVVTVGHKPMNVGSYDIKVITAETNNYNAWEATSAPGLTILPAPNPAFIQPAVTIKRGTSYDLSRLVSGAKGTVSFALKEPKDDYSLSGSTLTHAGNADSSCTITVTADGTEDGKSNYETFSGELTVNATDLLPQDSFRFANLSLEKTYGDEDFTVAATGAADGSTVTYSSSNEDVATVEADTGKVHICKIGTATITATAGATDTYASAAASYKLTVNKKPVTISGITAIDQEYNPTPNISLDISKAVIAGKLDGDDLAVTAWGTTVSADVGVQPVIISYMLSGTAAGNYTLANEGQQTSTTVTIRPKYVTVSGITAVNKTYDGTTEATLDYTNALIDNNHCTVWLAVTATGEFADKNVGDNKTVTISGLKLVGEAAENYRLAESGQQRTASASITAKEVGLIWTNTRLTYTGEAQKPTVTVTGVVEGDTCTVTVTGEQTHLGAHIATASGLSSSNYKLPENNTATFKISKAIPKVTTLPTASSITYGQTLTDSNLSGGAGSVSGSFAWKDSTVAPVVSDSQATEYDVVFTPTDTANYYEVECKLKLTVNQKEVGLTWSGTALTYNGSAQAPTATATGLVNNDVIGVTISGAQTNAGTYTATASGLTGDKAGNYKLPDANTTSFAIGQKEVGLTWGETALTYNGSAQAPAATATGLVNNDEIGVAVSGAQTNAGTGYTATASSLTGDKAGNYKLPGENTTTTFAIGQKEVGLTWSGTALTYNGLPQPTAQATGVANGDEIGVSVSGAQTNVGTGYTATASGLTGDKAGNYKLPGENTTTTFAIGKAPLTVTANPKTITYGDEPANDGVTYSGLVNSEPESVLGGTLAYAYSYAQYGDVGNNYTITPSGLTSSNYDISFATGTLTVGQKEVGLTWSGTALTYDGSAQAPTAEATGLVLNDVIGVTISGAQTNAGTYTATASGLTGDKAGNYKLPDAKTATFAIGKVPLTVTANPMTITYGDAPVNNGVVYSGFVNSETENDLAGTLGYDYSYTQYGDVGNSYTITPKGLTSDNYEITFNPGTLTVEQKEVGLTWSGTALTYNGLPQPTAQATGVANGDEIGVSVSGAQTNVGTGYTATASGLTGDKAGNYKLPGENTTTTFAIGKAPLTVTANPKTITYGDEPANDGVTYSGLVNSEPASVLGGTLAYAYSYAQYGDAGNNYTITPSGLTSSNYDISFAAGTLTVNPKPVTVSGIMAAGKEYDGKTDATLNTTGVVFQGKLDQDTLTVSGTGAFADKNVGEDKTVNISGLILGGESAGNYTLAESGQQTSAQATITAKTVKVSGIAADNKSYDGTDAATLNTTGAVFQGKLDQDTLTVSGTGAFADKNAGEDKTVNISGLILGGESAGNYTLAESGQQTSAQATITAKPVTVTAKNQSIYVRDTVPTLEGADFYTVSGFVGSDALTTPPTLAYQRDGSAVTPTNATAGAYDIVPSGASASANYTISYVNGMLTINEKGTQTIAAGDVTVTYGETGRKVSASVTDPATGGGTVSYAVKDGSGDYIGVDAATGALTIKKVPADGKAYVTVTAAETATYAQATKDVTVTVNKANAVPATVTANNRDFDGTEKPLVTVTGQASGGEMQYAPGTATEATGAYTASVPAATEAGTYYVWYMAKGDENHTDSEAKCVSVTIEPAQNPEPQDDPEPEIDKVRLFVEQSYQVLLGREPDEAGLKTWVEPMRIGSKSAAELVCSIMTSREFQAKSYSNEKQVDLLYLAMLHRATDAEGKATWQKVLNEKGLADAINGIARSPEFKGVCADYGIIAGSVRTPSDPSVTPSADPEKVESLLEHLYATLLGRKADETGLKDWGEKLAAGRISAMELVCGFVDSPEYEEKHYSNEQQLELLYQAMLHRSPDAAGKEAWLKAMESGTSLKEIIGGIAASEEFRKICEDYGINPGTGRPAPSGELPSEYDQEKLRAFLTHCYQAAFGRVPDEAGLQSWMELLNSGKTQPKAVLRSFADSQEMKTKNLNDQAFVEMLYRLYLNRDGEQDGIAGWMLMLSQGWSRTRVADAFADAPEFKQLAGSLKK